MDHRAGEMAVFVATADSGSFSAAGRKLGLTPSAVSKLVARIEDRLGTSLLLRSTRALQLTPEGALYLERARRILAEIDDAESLVTTGNVVPRGLLRVNTSVAFGEVHLLPLVPRFLALYPQVELDVSLTDTVIDLMDQRTDVAIRTGPLRDSTLKARKLLESRRVIVASPGYLKAHGLPRRPEDLSQHNCLRFNFRRPTDEWPFRDPASGEAYALPVSGNVHGNSGVMLRQLVLEGVGLARLGGYHVQPDIASGRLVAVLERYSAGDIELIHAVHIGHEHLATRVRTFIDFLVESLKGRAVR